MKNMENSYTETITISYKESRIIEGYLNATTESEYQDEDETIIHTVKFPNGYEIDVKCCGCQNEASWTEAVLFDSNGYEVSCTEVEEEYDGIWNLNYNGIEYNVVVVYETLEEFLAKTPIKCHDIHISKKMIEDGMMADCVHVGIDGNQFTATIGEHTFNFGRDGLPNNPRMVSLVDEIFNTLEEIYKHPEIYGDEYAYYYYYLQENI